MFRFYYLFNGCAPFPIFQWKMANTASCSYIRKGVHENMDSQDMLKEITHRCVTDLLWNRMAIIIRSKNIKEGK